MHPDLDAIVAADAAARRELHAAQQRLADQECRERARLETARESALAESRARLERDVGDVESSGMARVLARRAARQATRAARRSRAASGVTDAIAAYVRIVRGQTGGPGP